MKQTLIALISIASIVSFWYVSLKENYAYKHEDCHLPQLIYSENNIQKVFFFLIYDGHEFRDGARLRDNFSIPRTVFDWVRFSRRIS